MGWTTSCSIAWCWVGHDIGHWLSAMGSATVALGATVCCFSDFSCLTSNGHNFLIRTLNWTILGSMEILRSLEYIYAKKIAMIVILQAEYSQELLHVAWDDLKNPLFHFPKAINFSSKLQIEQSWTLWTA